MSHAFVSAIGALSQSVSTRLERGRMVPLSLAVGLEGYRADANYNHVQKRGVNVFIAERFIEGWPTARRRLQTLGIRIAREKLAIPLLLPYRFARADIAERH
jgi:hypothetical protein